MRCVLHEEDKLAHPHFLVSGCMLRVLTLQRDEAPARPQPCTAGPAKRPPLVAPPTGRGVLGMSKKTSGSQGGMSTKMSGSQGDATASCSKGVKRKSGMLGIAVYHGTDDAPAGETEKEHAVRHRTFHADCIRCVYHARKWKYDRGHGSYIHSDRSGNLQRTVWLAPRPLRMPGQFGVGCLFCNALRQRCEAELDAAARHGRKLPKQSRGAHYARTKWASFDIRSAVQLAPRGLKQHAATDQHRRAIRCYFAPPAAITSVVSPAEEADTALFKGAVPQVADWLRAWRAVRSGQSFLSAENSAGTEAFIRNSRIKGASRKAVRAMVGVMVRVLRRHKMRQLDAASNIAIALDDRGPIRLVTFKCDADRPATVKKGMWKGSVSGCLGVLKRGGDFEKKVLEDVDEDYSRAMATSIVRLIEKLCDGDAAKTKAICDKVVIAVADGDAKTQKALKFLATTSMHNLRWAGRDRAHALRIATGGALTAEQHFKEWWDDVFDARHALVLDIRNSEEWTAKLILCQKAVLRESGSQGGACIAVQRVINFAKQRYDSMASPQRQFCVMLIAIAMLLASVTSDWRVVAQTRERARARLLQMPDQVATIGLSASYSEEALIFVRGFDLGDHDPALTFSQAAKFIAKMRTLFLDGHIWDEERQGVRECESTLLEVALQQARSAAPIYYDGGKVLKLYRRLSPEEARRLCDSITAVVQAMIDRVEVELSADDLGVLFTCFDLQRWHAANVAAQENSCRIKLDLLETQTRRMFRSWGFDGSLGVREFTSMAFKLLALEAEYLRAGAARDNCMAWAQILEDGFLEVNDKVTVVIPMTRIYLIALDSTCGVERDLGVVTRALDAHAGPLDDNGDTLWDVTEVLLDGPTAELELGVWESGSDGSVAQQAGHNLCDACLTPTDLSREFGQQWLDDHGRRFRVYAQRAKKPGPKPRPPRLGTMAALMRGSRERVAKLSSKIDPPDLRRRSLLGMPLGDFWRGAGVANPARESKGLKKFDALTRRKAAAQKDLAEARLHCRSSNPYTLHTLNPNLKLRTGKAFHGPVNAHPTIRRVVGASGRIVVLDFCATALPARPGYVLSKPASAVPELIRQLKEAHLVVMDSLWFLDNQGTPTRQGIAINFGIVALGKSVLPRAQWQRCSPPPGGPPAAEVVHFRAAMRFVARNFVLSTDLKTSHLWLCQLIEAMTKSPQSAWIMKSAASSVTLKTLTDVRTFLLQARRVWHQGNARMGGRYVDSQR